ncbi:MAG TPA: Fe-S cluster assembly protein HesB, partial [Blastocatellia bacterium]|nr:Fe-S cluster assembly protein HesB [Blastocatellia bacterium]
MEILIDTPRTFNFKRTVVSHGWCELEPFAFDAPTWTLTRVLVPDQGGPMTVSITGSRSALQVSIPGRVGKRATQQITRDIRHMFRLDDDLSEFYRIIAGDPHYAWIGKEGAGRLLRSPTVFEDLVKMICTTNCSWALTHKMITGLVDSIGRESQDGRKAFPTPEAMAAEPERFYRDRVRAGYRAPYLRELAKRVASGSLEVEQWLHSADDTTLLKKEMKKVKGVGDYAAENLLKLVGRYDGLGIDSWVRATFNRVRNGGRKATDRKIERHYSQFGSWSGLAMWCDLTKA